MKAFLITTRFWLPKVLEEFPELSSLERLLLPDEPDVKKLYSVLLFTLNKPTIAFPFPFRPHFDPDVMSKQAAFAMIHQRLVKVSVYPRPDRVVRISKEPLIIGDILISPASLRKLIVDKRI